MNEITPKEAIANFNHIYGFVAPDIQRSLDVAIKALENQTTEGDLISREALKKHKFTTQVANGVEIEDIEVIPISTIDNAPAVHTKNDCIMKKCTICPHCDNCDVDENGKVHNERPKGEWIETSETWEEPGGYGMGYDWGYYYSCSICNNKVRNKTCFCDRCGADMRGENE